jgi:hypothetical protein
MAQRRSVLRGSARNFWRDPARAGPRSGSRGRQARPDIVHNGTQLGRIGFHFIDYGAAARVDVEVGPLDPFVVQLPLSGRAVIRAGDQEIIASASVGAVVTPDAPLPISYSDANPRILLRIDETPSETLRYGS